MGLIMRTARSSTLACFVHTKSLPIAMAYASRRDHSWGELFLAFAMGFVITGVLSIRFFWSELRYARERKEFTEAASTLCKICLVGGVILTVIVGAGGGDGSDHSEDLYRWR